MSIFRTRHRAVALAILGLSSGWYGCSDGQLAPPTGPALHRQGGPPDVAAAIVAQERHNEAILQIPGVVGTAVGLLPTGEATVRVFVARPGVVGVPRAVDHIPVSTKVTGEFYAITDPTGRVRPAPLGFSVGHPDITAGSIGARVVDGSGNVLILSNNHVLANSNSGSIGDPIWQPGAFDGGTASDQIATLFAFERIKFTSRARNTMDAAIALSSAADVGNSTPAAGGYGVPAATVYGDGDGDGMFDDRSDLLNLDVQKYGRTSGLTTGRITDINATVTVCYEAVIFCTKAARYIDQLIVGVPGFSDGGDSGSLIVSNDGNNQPVGLLFAGSSTATIANRIDRVLDRFDVTIDDGGGSPPTPVTDVAVTDVSAPSAVTGGTSPDVTVTVRNLGNQDVTDSFDAILLDDTDGVTIGVQPVPGLAAGATTTVTFNWNTAGSSLGDHTLSASHDLTDADPGNNQRTTIVAVTDPNAPVGVHVGDLDGFPSNDGSTWSVVVEVTIHDASHNPINDATVVGAWNPAGLASDACTTGDLGGNGTCIFLYPGLRKRTRSVTFTVTSVTLAGDTYVGDQNHDNDGSSDGTVITVNKP
jgi:hypothetical protein